MTENERNTGKKKKKWTGRHSERMTNLQERGKGQSWEDLVSMTNGAHDYKFNNSEFVNKSQQKRLESLFLLVFDKKVSIGAINLSVEGDAEGYGNWEVMGGFWS